MILKAADLTKSYGKIKVLDGVSLSVAAGESVAICGRSGSGKTTLLHILSTLEDPSSGLLKIDGEQISRSNRSRFRNQRIGFIFQEYNLLDDFTAIENVLMPARIARQQANRQKGLELLALVGLEDRADFPVKLLSGGEKQRAAIARALCNDPAIIFADEPSGNLDRANAKRIGELLISLKKSLVLVTHDPDLAALCQRQYLLDEGRLQQSERK